MSDTAAPARLKQPPGPQAPMQLDIDLASQQAIGALQQQYGDIIRIHIEGRANDTYVVIDPDAIQHILIRNHTNYIKGRGFERVKMLLGNGIIVSDGDFWRRQRTMIQPAFSRKHIHAMCAMMQAISQRMIARWGMAADAGEAIDLTTAMSDFALEVILRALIGNDLDSLIARHGENPFAFLSQDPARNLAVAMKFRQLAPLLQELIDRRRKHGERHADLLDALMHARDKQGQPMSDRELTDEVMTMIIAGHETSAGTLNWVWYELSRHDEAERRVLAEALQALGPATTGEGNADTGAAIDIEQVSRLVYTKQVINEALRLYPPVWLFTRKALADDRLGGYHLPADSDIFLSPFFTHRHPALWPQPERFMPERFADDGKHLAHKYAFIPFSAGSRRCIGEYFSYVEMQIHIATLIRHFRLQALPGQNVEIDPGINLRTRHPIMMSVARRDGSG